MKFHLRSGQQQQQSLSSFWTWKNRAQKERFMLILLVMAFCWWAVNFNFHAVGQHNAILNAKSEPTSGGSANTKMFHPQVIDLSAFNYSELSEDNNRTSRNDLFFDCNHSQSQCRYFYPGHFFRHYFLTMGNQNETNPYNQSFSHQGNLALEKRYLGWKKAVGLENANLPALTSLSWWWDEIDKSPDTEQIFDHIKSNVGLPQNLTYIHVHKCGGTSIQQAMRMGSRKINRIQYHIGFGDYFSNNTLLHSDQMFRHDQHQHKHRLADFSSHSELHVYKHSFGGGSSLKKRQWDKERWNQILSVAKGQMHRLEVKSQQTVPVHANIFTIIRDPIERFLSAVQQVMHYNTDFRDDCLRASLPPNRSIITPWSLLFGRFKTDQSTVKATDLKFEKDEATARQKTVQCAIEDMKVSNFRGDVHLLPMASHFRLLNDVEGVSDTSDVIQLDEGNISGDRGVGSSSDTDIPVEKNEVWDVAVSVFPMERMEDVLLRLSLENIVGSSNAAKSAGNTERSNHSDIHARDRSNTDYATSPILAKLSVRDCTDEMIQQLCSLYHIDVALMKWLGFHGLAVERC